MKRLFFCLGMMQVMLGAEEFKNGHAESLKEQAWFGWGDAVLMQRDYAAALEKYEEVLKLNPENEHAKKRIELIKKLMDEQRKEQDEKKKQDEQKNDEQKDDQKDKTSKINKISSLTMVSINKNNNQ